MKTIQEEIWKNIKGYEGLYKVSNLGRVKSLERLDSLGRRIKERILKNTLNNTGYQQVGLSKDGKKTLINIHQLVAIAFLGHTPNGVVMVVDHINGNKLDDRLENLRVVSHRENLSTCFRKDREMLSSKYIGVSWDKVTNKWQAQISIQGKRKHLGRYNSELEAHEAYKQTLKQFNSQSA